MDLDLEYSSIAPYVTFLISTRNRREGLLRTLADLRKIDRACGVVTQTIVVDNASDDGTVSAVESEYPEVDLVSLRRSSSRDSGLQRAAGELIIALDDDSVPTAASIGQMIDQFQNDPHLGAAVFNVGLPDGSRYSGAYPSVVLRGGTGFRRTALMEVGGDAVDLQSRTEQYDLSLRLLDRRWGVRRFDELQINHSQTFTADTSDTSPRATRRQVRDNLLVITRYFPRQWILPFAIDWTRRSYWIAKSGKPQQLRALALGIIQGIVQSLLPRHRHPMGLAAFEEFAMFVGIRRRLERAVRSWRFRTIVLADVSQNILPFLLAARACGLKVVAIADNQFAAPHRSYRGVTVISDEEAATMMFDAVVIATVSPVQAAARAQAWRKRQLRPVIDLFEPSAPLSKAA